MKNCWQLLRDLRPSVTRLAGAVGQTEDVREIYERGNVLEECRGPPGGRGRGGRGYFLACEVCEKFYALKIGRNVSSPSSFESRWRKQVMGMVISGAAGAALLIVGSNLVFPIGIEIGSFMALLGVGSMMVFFGLADGE
jgi:hypothetical protein